MRKNVLFKTTLLLVVMFFSFLGKVSAQTWQRVEITELTADDVFVIVDSTGSACYALSNVAISKNPAAVSITVTANQITSEVDGQLKWNISGDATEGFIFYPDGVTERRLYCNGSGAQIVKVGDMEDFEDYDRFSYDVDLQLLKNNHYSRYIGVYNGGTWRAYAETAINSNIPNSHTRFYKLMGTTPAVVATPTFSPAGGTYYGPQTVTISCATEGAVIHYTLDGTTPDGTSAVYSEPLTISTTTTVKAVAIVGDDASNVASVTYTFPEISNIANIAELRTQTADNSTLYRLTGEAVVSFTGNYRHHKYIQDATAGILIDDNSGTITSEYVAGDGMTGLIGTLTSYRNMLEFVPATDPGEASSHDNLLTPADIDLDADFESYEAQLVALSNVTVGAEGTFAANTDYPIVGSENVNIRLRYAESSLVGTEIPSAPQNITALVYQFDETYNLVLISLEDFVPEPTECENVPAMGACNAELDNRDMLFTGQVSVDDPLCTLYEYGFVYSTFNTLPVIDSVGCTKVVLGTTVEAGTPFTHRIAELGYDTYYVRAFATNEVGTGYSAVASVEQAQPEIYEVAFRVNGHEGWTRAADTAYVPEGDAVKFPWMEDCGNLTFAGWALQPFEGQTTEMPTLYNTFIPVSDTTFYAVFSNTQNVTNDEIVISRSSFPEGALAYATNDEWTAVSKVNGDVIQGIAALYSTESMTYMQMRSSTHPHPYNVTALPGFISSITLFSNSKSLGSTNTRQWIPWISSSPITEENYQTVIALDAYNLPASSSYTWNVDASAQATYFYLAMSNATAYIDSIVVAYTSGDALYTMSAVDTVTINQTICKGMTYEDSHFSTGEAGTHFALVPNGEYCATQYVLNLTLRDTTRNYSVVDTCDIFVLDNESYGNSQIVTIITPATEPYGCPVVDEWDITIRHSSEGDTTAVACGSFDWHGYTGLTESGNYLDTIVNAEGCDSIVTLHLTINHGEYVEVPVDTCSTEFYWALADTTIDQSGTYYYYSTNANTCTDTTVLLLSLHQAVTKELSAQICEGETYNQDGFDVSTAGDHQLDLQTVNGCDSTVILHLTVGNAAVSYLTPSICEGESYNENGFAIDAPAVGVLVDSIIIERPGTCDSIVKLTLTVNALPTVTISGETSFCEGGSTTLTASGAETYAWSATDNAAEYTVAVAGNYTVTGTDANNCQNTATKTVEVNTLPTVAISGETAFCEGGSTTLTASGAETYEWSATDNGTEYTVTVAGTYTVTGTDDNGCQNTASVEVTENALPTVIISGETSFCDGGRTTLMASGAVSYEWSETDLNAELTVAEAGTYTVTGTDINGCQNTASVEVTENALPTVTISGETAFCEGGSTTLTASGAVTYAWSATDNGAEYTVAVAGTYTVTGTDANDCQNTASIEVTAYPVAVEPAEATICESDLPYRYVNGAIDTTFDVGTPNLSTFDFQLLTSHGCDSTVTLTLTIHPTTEGDTAAIACGSFDWHNYTGLTESGYYLDTLVNAAGCDSIVTLHLTINVPTEGDTAAIACGSFDWYDYNGLTQSGDYYHTFIAGNAAGCDSTVTLHLTINTPTESDTNAIACGSFDWHSYTGLTESGDYTDVLTNAAGCDSTVTLHLTINPLPTVTISGETSFCEGSSTTLTAIGAETYVWNTADSVADITVAEAGTYSVTGTDTNGCQNRASKEVSVYPVVTELVEVTICENELPYHYVNGAIDTTFDVGTPELSTFNFQLFTSHGCDSIVTLTLTINTCDTIGITTYDDGILALYPNPTNSTITLQLTPETCTLTPEIQIFDIYGKRLQVISVTDERTEIDLSSYATGVYLVKLVSDGRVIGVRKVVRR